MDGLRWGGCETRSLGLHRRARGFPFRTFSHFRAVTILGCDSPVLRHRAVVACGCELGLGTCSEDPLWKRWVHRGEETSSHRPRGCSANPRGGLGWSPHPWTSVVLGGAGWSENSPTAGAPGASLSSQCPCPKSRELVPTAWRWDGAHPDIVTPGFLQPGSPKTPKFSGSRVGALMGPVHVLWPHFSKCPWWVKKCSSV